MADNFEVHDEPIENVLRDIGRSLRSVCPPGYGFAFLLSQFGEGGANFYISNVMRGDCIKLLREMADKLEAQ